MPTLTKRKKSAKKVMKRSKTKVLKKKKTTMKKKAMKKVMKKVKVAAKPKVLGKVIHFYDKISVAIVKLIAPVSVGDTVVFRRGEFAHTQLVRSMQIDHEQVLKAKKGDVIGMQVSQYIAEGALVVPVK